MKQCTCMHMLSVFLYEGLLWWCRLMSIKGGSRLAASYEHVYPLGPALIDKRLGFAWSPSQI